MTRKISLLGCDTVMELVTYESDDPGKVELVRTGRIELPTYRLEGGGSIHLSYVLSRLKPRSGWWYSWMGQRSRFAEIGGRR